MTLLRLQYTSAVLHWGKVSRISLSARAGHAGQMPTGGKLELGRRWPLYHSHHDVLTCHLKFHLSILDLIRWPSGPFTSPMYRYIEVFSKPGLGRAPALRLPMADDNLNIES